MYPIVENSLIFTLTTHDPYIYSLSTLLVASVTYAEAFLHFHVVRQQVPLLSCLYHDKPVDFISDQRSQILLFARFVKSFYGGFRPAVRDHVRKYAQWLTLTSLSFVHT